MPKPILFNLNDHVSVKLREPGRSVYARYYDRPAPHGWVVFQLHELMRVFGPSLPAGFDPPFETTILLLPEAD